MNKANLSIFASGAGSNLLAIHKASIDREFPGQIQLVICNKICPAFELAKDLNYTTKLISNLDVKKFELIRTKFFKSKLREKNKQDLS